MYRCLLNSFVLLRTLVNSFAADHGTLTYTQSGGNATVTGCVAACPAALVIPKIIDGYSVTIRQWVLSFPFQLRFLFASYSQIRINSHQLSHLNLMSTAS